MFLRKFFFKFLVISKTFFFWDGDFISDSQKTDYLIPSPNIFHHLYLLIKCPHIFHHLYLLIKCPFQYHSSLNSPLLRLSFSNLRLSLHLLHCSNILHHLYLLIKCPFQYHSSLNSPLLRLSFSILRLSLHLLHCPNILLIYTFLLNVHSSTILL